MHGLLLSGQQAIVRAVSQLSHDWLGIAVVDMTCYPAAFRKANQARRELIDAIKVNLAQMQAKLQDPRYTHPHPPPPTGGNPTTTPSPSAET